MNTVQDIAKEIYFELGEPNDLSEEFISSWLRYNIGSLNTLLDLCVNIQEPELIFSPTLSSEEKSIYKEIFYIYFYKRMVNKNLGAANYGSNNGTNDDWIEIREGDSAIKRINKNEVSKNYITLKKDSEENLKTLVRTYRMNKSHIHQVVGDDTEQGSFLGGSYPENNRYY